MQPIISNLTRLIAIAMLSLTAFSGTASAQAQDLTGGLKAGLGITDLYGDDVSGTEVRVLFSGGAFLNYRPSSVFALQPEVLFSVKGADVETGVMGEGETVTYAFGYLEIPLLAKLYVPTRHTMQPNLFAGPALGITLYGEADDEDLEDSLKDTDVGLVFGGGLDFPVGRRMITLDGRYTLGLTDVFNVPGDPEARNGAFTVAVGIGF